MQTFESLQELIKNGLQKSLLSNKITQEDLLVILGILAEAKDLNELEVLISSFADDFEFLDEIVLNETSQTRQNRDKDLQILISALLKENPTQATEIMDYLSQNKSATTEQVMAKFPVLTNFK
jgi:hypothetical protein